MEQTRRTRRGDRQRQATSFPPDPEWYRDAVIYEVHVRAFQDGNGDGIGDFAGLTSRLDYLADLGVTAVWLLPFYPSPLRDDGYDIADYLAIHTDYGDLADARRFIREAHARGLRVITELVFNHTSDQHPWFQRARRAATDSAERDWYVWSDTPDRYRDARIIFKDFEPSNWSWDPVAGAYFWHRFYSHQPDLNFDHPAVGKALLRIVDYWLEAGVDGLRLDAIPYLYEREGTSGENLPETHAFLKRLRRHVDERFADRMLLAEANQWPEDSVAYFGDGDECHMAFHFPVMPRLFMALRQEDRYPIMDILAQTPDLPPTAQWAVFLRNHDELTLEMVTDEERDYMYRVYAADPQARINLGIRRRLAPLLDNNRRRIELMNGLLFSLPGTPVVYYGDEIGMGDNVYLGDRNGVRTPMQWSSDRNAGFSEANRQRLFLPVVTDPEYHYEAVNVEAQQSNPQSLLWWMRRIIGLRKRHPAFGRGSLRFLQPANRRILAFIREHGDETLLVVANLSRYAQWTEIGLEQYAGRVPVELFGATAFPRIESEPWRISLGPHSFLWFRLVGTAGAEAHRDKADLPELAWRGDLPGLARRPGEDLSNALVRWIARQPWYRGGALEVQSARVVDAVELATGGPAALFSVQVMYRHAEPVTYLVPVTTDEQPGGTQLLGPAPDAVIARLRGAAGVVNLLDGSLVPGVHEALLRIVAGRRLVRGSSAALRGSLRERLGFRERDIGRSVLAAPLLRGGMTAVPGSASFADRAVLTLRHAVEAGPDPELELLTFLADGRFAHAPAILGWLDVVRGGRSSATIATVQAFVPHEGDLWLAMRDGVRAFLQDVASEGASPAGTDDERDLVGLSRRDPPEVALRLLGPSLAVARRLGQRVGEVHGVLASADARHPAFAPEPLSPFNVRSLYQSIRQRVVGAMELLAAARSTAAPDDLAAIDAILERAPRLETELGRLREVEIDGQRIRVHGDLHLGHVLDTGDDVVIVGFEGDPARPKSERRLKRSALSDLASLVCSLHLAAHRPAGESAISPESRPAEAEAAWARSWARWMSAACIAGYREATAGATFLPSDETAWAVLFRSLLVARACDELVSRLSASRGAAAVALAGLEEILDAPPS